MEISDNFSFSFFNCMFLSIFQENMTIIISSSGGKTSVVVRRTESCDAQKITELINPATTAVFGSVDVIYLL